jgi:hypothetical protein
VAAAIEIAATSIRTKKAMGTRFKGRPPISDVIEVNALAPV